MKQMLLILAILISFSCADRKKTADKPVKPVVETVSNIDTTLKKETVNKPPDSSILHPAGYKDISRFYDTSINGIRMNDCDTIVQLFGENYKLLPDLDDLPAIQVLNNDKSQLLTMYMWNGSSRCDFSQFQIEYALKEEKYFKKPFHLNLANFESGKKIELGLSSKQVQSKLGKPNEIRHEKGLIILSYQQYNDLYFGDYYFKNDQLIKFRFGNEYP